MEMRNAGNGFLHSSSYEFSYDQRLVGQNWLLKLAITARVRIQQLYPFSLRKAWHWGLNGASNAGSILLPA